GNFTVTLEATSTFGCIESTQEVVIISPLPEADFTADDVCLGNITAFNDASTIPSGFGLSAYQWNFGDGNTSNQANPMHLYTAPGVYSVSLSISTNAGCTDLVAKQVTVNERPIADFDTELVCSSNTLTFTNLSTVNALRGYEWDFGNGETSIFESPTITFNDEGTFNVTLTVETVYGCQDQYSMDVDIVAPTPLFSPEVETCGTSFLLDADPGGIYTGSDFLWSTTETTSAISATSTGVYTVTITEPNGCVTVGSTFVRLNEPLTIDLDDQINGCDELTLDAGFFSGAIYSWSTGEDTQRITVTESDNYSISVTDNNGCVTSKNIQVTINPSLVVDLGEDLNLCFGETALLDAGNPGNNYLWSNGATTQTITVDRPNEYWVDVTSPTTGCTTRDNVLVFIYDDFDIDLGPDRITCPGSPVTLVAPIDDVFYLWSSETGDLGTNQEQTFETPGKYWLTITNQEGCQAADTILIEESFNSITADFIASSLVDEGDTIQFVNLSFPDPTGYVWDFGDGTTSTDFEPQKTYLTEGSYTVTLSATNGTCTNVLTKVITVRPLRESQLPGQEPLIYPEIVDIKLFPNPMKNKIKFEIETTSETLIYMDLVMLNGSVLRWKEYTSKEVKDSFNVANLRSGIYLLRVKVGKQVKIYRVMKSE
ncbi:MAG: PKD domain-containing protein, partial [Bacteroidota bacterium]